MAAETINVVMAVANITADPSPAVSMVSYFCDTTGGNFFVTVPNVADVTDGIQIRVTLSVGVGGLAVTTVGGTDLIGTSISQKIVLAGTGITIQANVGAGKWEIIQDSRNVWGGITGTLSDQTDLQAALDALKPLPFNGMIEAPVNKTYVVCEAAPFAFTINTLIAILQSGTLSVAVQINGTPVTGINTLAVSSVQATGTATALNTVAIGQRVTFVVTGASAPNDFSWTLKGTR